MNLLEVTKLVKIYNDRTVVNDVSFVLRQQEVVGLLGRNGAGKTTTFRMILGMVEPDSGAVAFDATDITFLPMYKRARLGIGYLSQERSDFRRLSVFKTSWRFSKPSLSPAASGIAAPKPSSINMA